MGCMAPRLCQATLLVRVNGKSPGPTVLRGAAEQSAVPAYRTGKELQKPVLWHTNKTEGVTMALPDRLEPDVHSV